MAIRSYFIVLLLLITSSCINKKVKYDDKLILTRTNFSHLHGWKNDNMEEFWNSFKRSCDKFAYQDSNKELKFGPFYKAGKIQDWQNICNRMSVIDHHNLKEFIVDNFNVYAVSSAKKGEKGLFTGYYEIDLEGNHTKTKKYRYPVYARPLDKIDGIKYFSRETIVNECILANRDLELYWVSDRIRLFLMHIQGSGRIKLPDGSFSRVGYHGQNEHLYTGIGKVLVDKKAIRPDNVSIDSISRWLYHNPEKTNEILNQNQSFIFFRKLATIDGPIGAQGVELIAERSLAIDRKYFPLGIPIWLETTYPTTNIDKSHRFSKLLVAQDTGGAIKGVIRGDIFFGNGKKAERFAGYMKNKGKYFVLLPKSIKP